MFGFADSPDSNCRLLTVVTVELDVVELEDANDTVWPVQVAAAAVVETVVLTVEAVVEITGGPVVDAKVV